MNSIGHHCFALSEGLCAALPATMRKETRKRTAIPLRIKTPPTTVRRQSIRKGGSSQLISPDPQVLVSPDCVVDASLVPETCLDRFVDLKGLTQQVSGESPNRKLKKSTSPVSVNQASNQF